MLRMSLLILSRDLMYSNFHSAMLGKENGKFSALKLRQIAPKLVDKLVEGRFPIYNSEALEDVYDRQ